MVESETVGGKNVFSLTIRTEKGKKGERFGLSPPKGKPLITPNSPKPCLTPTLFEIVIFGCEFPVCVDEGGKLFPFDVARELSCTLFVLLCGGQKKKARCIRVIVIKIIFSVERWSFVHVLEKEERKLRGINACCRPKVFTVIQHR